MLYQNPVRFPLLFSRLFAALFIACGVSAAAAVHAQERGGVRRDAPQRPASKSKAERTAKNKRAEETRARRERQQAVAVVVQTAEAARSFESLHDRARVQALAADALWPFDESAARAIFRRAWEAATASDASDVPQEAQSMGGPATTNTTAPAVSTFSREEVLSLVARHDAKLSEVFLRDMSESLAVNRPDARATGSESGSRHDLAWQGFDLRGQRLGLAFSLLEDGEYRRAAELAAPAVAEGASGNLLTFLLRLRAHAPSEADALYTRLLERTRLDARADSNDVLLLSSYVVSPKLLTVVDEHGSVQFRPVHYERDVDAPEPPALSPRLRKVFFDVAAKVLLQRGLTTGENNESARGKRIAGYYATGRLLPFFAQEAAGYVPELQALQSALASEVGAERGERLSAQMGTRSMTAENSSDPLRFDLEKVGRATNDAERDAARFSATGAAARRKLWERARQLAAGIVDAELRQAAQTLIQSHQVLSVLEAYGGADDDDEDMERGANLVRGADVPAAIRAAGFAQVAELAARRGRRERAAELFDEAVNFAQQSKQGTEERLAVFGTLSMAAARMNNSRVWEMLASTVSAANALESYTDDDLALGFRVKTATLESSSPVSEPFSLEEVFAEAARAGASRALSEALALDAGVPKALASLAVARTLLDKSGKGAEARSSGRGAL